MKPTQERLKKEWRAIYKGWLKRGCPKDEVPPAMRLAIKYKIPCQEVLEAVGRWRRQADAARSFYYDPCPEHGAFCRYWR